MESNNLCILDLCAFQRGLIHPAGLTASLPQRGNIKMSKKPSVEKLQGYGTDSMEFSNVNSQSRHLCSFPSASHSGEGDGEGHMSQELVKTAF